MSPSASATESLLQLRREIESVDLSIVLLLAARLDAARRALRLRAGEAGRTTDAAQERRVLRRARAWARELDLPERLVEHLFRTLMEEGKARHRRGIDRVDPSAFVTVLMSPPEGVLAGALGGGTGSQLAPEPASR